MRYYVVCACRLITTGLIEYPTTVSPDAVTYASAPAAITIHPSWCCQFCEKRKRRGIIFICYCFDLFNFLYLKNQLKGKQFNCNFILNFNVLLSWAILCFACVFLWCAPLLLRMRIESSEFYILPYKLTDIITRAETNAIVAIIVEGFIKLQIFIKLKYINLFN